MEWREDRDDGHGHVVAARQNEGQVQDRDQRLGLRPVVADQAILAIAEARIAFRLKSYRRSGTCQELQERGPLARRLAGRLPAVPRMVATGEQVQRLARHRDRAEEGGQQPSQGCTKLLRHARYLPPGQKRTADTAIRSHTITNPADWQGCCESGKCVGLGDGRTDAKRCSANPSNFRANSCGAGVPPASSRAGETPAPQMAGLAPLDPP